MTRIDPRGQRATLGRILVVDDDAAMRNLLAEYFSAEGFVVTTAADGDQALATIKSDCPGLILLDVMLPGVNGLEVLRRARRDAPSTVVVMLTGLQDEALARATLRIGAFDYVSKPIDFTRLQQVVLAALGRAPGDLAEGAG